MDTNTRTKSATFLHCNSSALIGSRAKAISKVRSSKPRLSCSRPITSAKKP
ncbi:Uncharacterised protein [Vibrio cholerae]|nr:Uncharacterised protein [Vibrio cholerae]